MAESKPTEVPEKVAGFETLSADMGIDDIEDSPVSRCPPGLSAKVPGLDSSEDEPLIQATREV